MNNNKNNNISNINNTISVYKPKKPTLTKVGSRVKIGVAQNPFLNKLNLQIQPNFFNNNRSTKNIFSRGGNKIGKIPYMKKPQINFYNVNNNSVYDININD